jgi:hypothetical protein
MDAPVKGCSAGPEVLVPTAAFCHFRVALDRPYSHSPVNGVYLSHVHARGGEEDNVSH